MRIIAGEFRNRPLKSPAGQSTRPTGGRVREAVFNVLEHADWTVPLAGARVIDLFAGSGALGLEAMSRGADFCLFVDTSAAARAAIRDNVEAFALFGVTRLHRRSATDLGQKPAGLGEAFDIAFLDPPYGQELVTPCLSVLVSGGWLRPNCTLVVETGSDETLQAPAFEIKDERSFGAARVWFLRGPG